MQATRVEISWDYKIFYLNKKPFFPVLQQDGAFNPKCFNGYVISLPTDNLDMDWTAQKVFAEEIIHKGGCLLWEIDFSQINEEIFSYYQQILEKFNKEIFSNFDRSSIGVILYKGPFLKNSKDNETFFMTMIELASHLPIEVPGVLLFDCQAMSLSSLVFSHLFSKHSSNFIIGTKGAKIPTPSLCWGKGKGHLGFIGNDYDILERFQPCKTAICFSETISSQEFFLWDNLFTELKDKNIAYRLITEHKLSEEWEGIDFLLVQKKYLTERTFRQIKGFVSAGGGIVFLDEPLNVENEISLPVFLNMQF